jgi:hypothetical protein
MPRQDEGERLGGLSGQTKVAIWENSYWGFVQNYTWEW